MQKKFEINETKVKCGFQSGRKVVAHNSKSDLPLVVHLLLKWGKSVLESIVTTLELPHISHH